MAAQHAMILAGGQSRRFGRDKTALEMDGQLLLAHLVNVLQASHHEITILGPQNSHLSSLGCRILPDAQPFSGSMLAIADAMTALSCRETLVVAADMPFLNPRVAASMWSALGDNWAVVLEGATLPAIYTSDVIDVMRSLLRQDERRLGQLHAEISGKTYSVPRSLWMALDPRGWSIHNINFPEDWERCRNHSLP